MCVVLVVIIESLELFEGWESGDVDKLKIMDKELGDFEFLLLCYFVVSGIVFNVLFGLMFLIGVM